MPSAAKFCPTCGTAVHPTQGCRKCSGSFTKNGSGGGGAAAPPARRRGGASFSGQKGKYQRFGRDPSARKGGQSALQGVAAEKEPAPLVERAATRWDGRTSGAPHPVLGLFPFDTIRDGQKTFARDVQRAVRRREHLVAHAPTGLGKTAASVAPALHAALDADKRLLVLTSKQSQHRIVVDTLRRITETRGARFAAVDVIGKRDMCPRPEKEEIPAFAFLDHCARLCKTKQCRYFMAESDDAVEESRRGIHHVEELVDISLTHGCCPHKVAMEAAKKADVIVCDYNYLFSDMRERILDALGGKLGDFLVVVDEAHNLPDRVRANFSLDLNSYLLQEARLEARREKDLKAERACKVFEDTVTELASAYDTFDEAVLAKQDLVEPFEAKMQGSTIDGTVYSFKDWIKSLEDIADRLTKNEQNVVRTGQLAEFLAAWVYGTKAHGRILRIEKGGAWRLVHTLLDPAPICGPIFSECLASITMSGTLYPPEMYRDMLGLPEDRTRIKLYRSPYDPAHRPIVCVKGVTTRYKDRTEGMFRTIADQIARMHLLSGGNTAAFFPSYDLLNRTLVHLEGRIDETIVETKGMGKAERDRVLDTLEGARQHRTGALLMGVLGGSLSEGVDYKDNLLRCVSVVGLPLAPPGREVDLLTEHFERKFPGKGKDYGYVMPAMTRVLQAAGRGVRSAEDRCAVVLLDERFAWRGYARCFPDDFRPVLVDDPAEALRDFYGGFETLPPSAFA